MRRIGIILAIAAQVGLLAVLAGQREWVVRTGRPIVLRSAPFDPQDPMRGDYVRLQYELSRVPKEMCRDGLTAWFARPRNDWKYERTLRDRPVFAQLKLDRDNMAELVALTDRRPAGGIYIRGRVNYVDETAVQVRYGVEALFTQQGGAEAFETRTRRDRAGVPVDAEVALGRTGIAVLRGYRWESLGIIVKLDHGPAIDPDTGPRRRPLVGMSVLLTNHGTTPIAIVDRPGARSFRLLCGEFRWSEVDYHWVHENDPVPPARSEDVVVLQPGESRTIAVNLADPDWFVRKQNPKTGPARPVPLTRLDDPYGAYLRIEYAPPTEAECAGLPHGDVIQTRPLRSRAFSTAGAFVD